MVFSERFRNACDLLQDPSTNHSGQAQLDVLFSEFSFPDLERSLFECLQMMSTAENAKQLLSFYGTVAASMFQRALQRDAGVMSAADTGNILNAGYDLCKALGTGPATNTLSQACAFLLKAHVMQNYENISNVATVVDSLMRDFDEKGSARFVLDILDVFSNQVTTTATLATPIGQHEEVRVLFSINTNILRNVFNTSLASIRNCYEGGPAVSVTDIKIVSRILCWNFDGANGMAAGLLRSMSDQDVTMPERITFPNPSWIELVDEVLISNVVRFALSLSTSDPRCLEAMIILEQFCGVKCMSDLGHNNNLQVDTMEPVKKFILESIVQTCSRTPFAEATAHIRQLAAHCLHRAFDVHSVLPVFEWLPSLPRMILPQFVGITCELFEIHRMVGDAVSESAVCAATSCWSRIYTAICTDPTNKARYYDPSLEEFSFQLFSAFITVLVTKHGDETVEFPTDAIEAIALVARENVVACLEVMDNAVGACLGNSSKPRSSVVCVLLEQAACILADEAVGERPAIPSCFISIALRMERDQCECTISSHPVTRHIMQWVSYVRGLGHTLPQTIPEQTFIVLLDFFTRVSATYVDPDPEIQSDDITSIAIFSTSPDLSMHIIEAMFFCALGSWNAANPKRNETSCHAMLRTIEYKTNKVKQLCSEHPLYQACVSAATQQQDVKGLAALLSMIPEDSIAPFALQHGVLRSHPRLTVCALASVAENSKTVLDAVVPHIHNTCEGHGTINAEIFKFDSAENIIISLRLLTNLATACATFCVVYSADLFINVTSVFALPTDWRLDSDEYHAVILAYTHLASALLQLSSSLDSESSAAHGVRRAFAQSYFGCLLDHLMIQSHERYEYMMHTPDIQTAVVEVAVSFVEEFGIPAGGDDDRARSMLEQLLLRDALNSNVQSVVELAYSALRALTEGQRGLDTNEAFLTEACRVCVRSALNFSLGRGVASTLAAVFMGAMSQMGPGCFVEIVRDEVSKRQHQVAHPQKVLHIFEEVANVFQNLSNGRSSRKTYMTACGSVETLLFGLNLLRIR
eukprot:PhM_4_TR1337/c0_g1_i1/m.48700